jgi:Sugar (and other) transporter
MWLFGLNRRKDSSISCGLLNSWDNLTLAVLSVYFMFCNKHWFNICLIMSCSGLVAHVFMQTIVPDSPRWLLSKGKREEAIAALNTIARINGS